MTTITAEWEHAVNAVAGRTAYAHRLDVDDCRQELWMRLLGLGRGTRRTTGRPIDWYQPLASPRDDRRQRIRFVSRWRNTDRRQVRECNTTDTHLDRALPGVTPRDTERRDLVRWLFRRLDRPSRVVLGQLMLGRGTAETARRHGHSRQYWHQHLQRALSRAKHILDCSGYTAAELLGDG